MDLSIFQVDAFTHEPFAGNPAGVCVLPAAVDAEWMQHVALEMNLSETAFLHKETGGYCLRWFTPQAEVALCGHATLASAHVLWQEGHLAPTEVAHFLTLSGSLSAERQSGWIFMDFPATPVREVSSPKQLLAALGCEPVFVGRSRFDYLIELRTEEEIKSLTPDTLLLSRIETRGVTVTARSEEYDFVSRSFYPGLGVPEDPVTGSAHCALAPYWAERLGKTALRAYQASQRGGHLRVETKGDRVRLGGQAVTTLKGQLCVPPE